MVDPAIIKAVQDADRIYITQLEPLTTQDLLLRKTGRTTDPPVELGIPSEWGCGMPLLSKNHFSQLSASLVKQRIANQVLVKANE